MPRWAPVVLADSEAHRRLGSRGQVLPELFSGYVPTLNFGDVSGLIPGPGPPRGFAGVQVTGVGGLRAAAVIQPRTRGGLVVERIFLNSHAGTAVWIIELTATVPTFPNTPVANMSGPGNPAPVAVFQAGATALNFIAQNGRIPNTLGLIEVNFWVPFGQDMRLWQQALGVTGDVVMVFRELEELPRSVA